MNNFRSMPAPPLPPGVPRYPGVGNNAGGGNAFTAKVSGAVFVLNLCAVILGLVNIGIVGYNFSYHKGTYRNNLFHSELAFLVVFCAAFVGTVVNVVGNLVTPQPYATNTIHEEVSAAAHAFITALGSTVLLIQLSIYGRYFVNSFEVKVFAGILGLVEALVYCVLTLVLHRNAQSLM